MNDAQPTVTAIETERRGSARIARIALWAALAVALASRAAFLESKPFWRDEAWVAILVADQQAAVEPRPVPIGFLALTKAAAALPALPVEVTFRLVPLLCGVAVLPLLGRLGVALGATPLVAVAAVWLATGSTPLIYYSRELKSYGVDVLLAVLVPLLALRGFDGRLSRRAARVALIVCLAVAPWVSFGAVFPILAVLVWGWITWWRRGERSTRRDWLLANAAFLASFGVVYVVAVAGQVANPDLREFWRTLLLTESGGSLPSRVAVAIQSYFAVALPYFFPWQMWAFVALAALGAATWPRRHRGFLLWLYLASATFCIGAAAFDRYLLAHGRFMLFSLPLLLLWIANGLAFLGRPIRLSLAPYLALAAAIALGSTAARDTILWRIGPYRTVIFRYDVLQDIDALVAKAAAVIPPDEAVLVSLYAASPFEFYARGRLPQAAYCARLCRDFDGITREWLHRLDARGWMIVTDEEVDRLAGVVAAAGVDQRTRATARGVYLWEITPRARLSAPAAS